MATKRIKNLIQTATKNDVKSGAFFVIDTEEATKRLPAEVLEGATNVSKTTDSEYVYAIVDNSNRVLFGVKKDGSVDWPLGVPSPVVAYLNQALSVSLQEKVDKEEGKSLIDSTFASGVSFVSNDEYLFAILDCTGHVVLGVNKKGEISCEFLNGSLVAPIFGKATGSIKSDEYAYVIKDKDERVLFGIRSNGSVEIGSNANSSIASSEYVTSLVQVERTRAQAAEESLQSEINSITPTIVEGGTNNPDEFFLTEVQNYITLKSRTAGVVGKGLRFVRPTDSLDTMFAQPNTHYVVVSPLDLGGGSVTIGENSIIEFVCGGVYNGTLTGNHSTLVGSGVISATTTIDGTWNMPTIDSSLLAAPSTPNELRKLAAFLDPGILNEIIVRPGNYTFTPEEEEDTLILLVDNTHLKIEGHIAVTTNGFSHYYVVSAQDKQNIKIYGTGKLSGDADSHDYTTTLSTHEWCHCLRVLHCEGVEVGGLTLEGAPGDGLSISGTNVWVHDLIISHCGRQGISVFNGENYTIERCVIYDIYRVLPKAAIDVEPNWLSANNVKISNIIMSHCTGLQFLRTQGAIVNNVTGTNCGQLLYFRNSANVHVRDLYYSGSTESSMFIKVDDAKAGEAECSDIVLERVISTSTASVSINYKNLTLGFGCKFNGAVVEENFPYEGSVKYQDGKYVMSNGTAWVNFDGSALN